MSSGLGPRIRAARRAKGMRQLDLAHALDVTQASVSRWEKGRSVPDWPLRSRLAELLEAPDLFQAVSA